MMYARPEEHEITIGLEQLLTPQAREHLLVDSVLAGAQRAPEEIRKALDLMADDTVHSAVLAYRYRDVLDSVLLQTLYSRAQESDTASPVEKFKLALLYDDLPRANVLATDAIPALVNYQSSALTHVERLDPTHQTTIKTAARDIIDRAVHDLSSLSSDQDPDEDPSEVESNVQKAYQLAQRTNDLPYLIEAFQTKGLVHRAYFVASNAHNEAVANTLYPSALDELLPPRPSKSFYRSLPRISDSLNSLIRLAPEKYKPLILSRLRQAGEKTKKPQTLSLLASFMKGSALGAEGKELSAELLDRAYHLFFGRREYREAISVTSSPEREVDCLEKLGEYASAWSSMRREPDMRKRKYLEYLAFFESKKDYHSARRLAEDMGDKQRLAAYMLFERLDDSISFKGELLDRLLAQKKSQTSHK